MVKMRTKQTRQRDSNQEFYSNDNFATLRSKSYRNVLSTSDKRSVSEGRRKKRDARSRLGLCHPPYPLPLGGSKTKIPRLPWNWMFEFKVDFSSHISEVYPDCGHCLRSSPRCYLHCTGHADLLLLLGHCPARLHAHFYPLVLLGLPARVHPYMTSALKVKGEQVCPYYGGLRVILTPCCGRSSHAETEELGIRM